ncbi:MAG: hypothetical protein NVS4B6_28620 [Mycobacterium sp.]
MAVTVKLRGGGTDKYMRFHDAYVKHNDGTLDVVGGGAKRPYSYAPGVWIEVEGDEKGWNTGRFGS